MQPQNTEIPPRSTSQAGLASDLKSPRRGTLPDALPGLLASLIAFLVYLTTLAPSIGWEEDSGELAAAFATLGIPHPSGYPLFTPLAWAFSHLPLGERPIWRLNLLMAVLCAVAVYLFYRLFLFLLRDGGKVFAAPSRGRQSVRGPSVDTGAEPWAAAGAVLVLAFTKTFWTESVSIEVYAMHLVLTALLLLTYLRALSSWSENPDGKTDTTWHLFALVLGFSMAHHLMTVMLAPAFLYGFLTVKGTTRSEMFAVVKPGLKRIAAGIPALLLGLSAYLYLPLRAAAGPLMNWGNPVDLPRFWFHVTGRQYSYKMFDSGQSAWDKFTGFAGALPGEVGYFPLALAVIGAWLMFRTSRRLFVFTALLFLGCLFFALNYGFNDPNFYLNAYAALALWVAFALAALPQVFGFSKRKPSQVAHVRKPVAHAKPSSSPAASAAPAGQSTTKMTLVGVASFLPALFPLILNHSAVDQSRNHAIDEYARNVLAPLDSGAVVLTGQYAYLTAPGFYLQLVEGVRSDVLILDTQMLKFPWYLESMARRHPELFEACRPELEAFLRANARFEAESGLDSAAFVRYTLPQYQAMVRTLMHHAVANGSAYVTSEVEVPPEWNLFKTPVGLTFRLADAEIQGIPPLRFTFRPVPDNAPSAAFVRNFYAVGYLNQALYQALVRRDTLTGTDFLRRAVAVKPDFWPARNLLRQVGAALPSATSGSPTPQP